MPREALGVSLGAGDIGLVTEQDACCGAVVPSKVYGLLAAGRPVLFIGPRQATPARIVERFACGWQVDVGDVAGLTALLLRLDGNRDEVAAAARRARETLVAHFDLPLGTERICKLLNVAPLPVAADSQTSDGLVDVLTDERLVEAHQ